MSANDTPNLLDKIDELDLALERLGGLFAACELIGDGLDHNADAATTKALSAFVAAGGAFLADAQQCSDTIHNMTRQAVQHGH